MEKLYNIATTLYDITHCRLGTVDALGNVSVGEQVHLLETKDFNSFHRF